MANPEQKLIVVITSNDEADAVIRKLVEQGYPATKVSSTGGFLRKGNATIFSGVEADDIDNVMSIIRSGVPRPHRLRAGAGAPVPGKHLPRGAGASARRRRDRVRAAGGAV